LLYQSTTTLNGVQFVTAPVERGDLNVVVSATGNIQPTNKVDVSSELSGIVRRVLVDYNSQVVNGQVLAELDTDKLRSTVESSRAKLDVARAKVKELDTTVAETARDHERKKALVESRVSSEREFDVARALHDRALANLASARADVEAAAADLRLNETNLAKASIRSPINGVVLVRNVDPGQTVASSLQAPVLFTIAEDLRKMEAQVNVDEADVGQVREGQQAIALRLGDGAGRRHLQGGPDRRQRRAPVAAGHDGDGGDPGAAGS
jgi:HlyD family secretion protein